MQNSVKRRAGRGSHWYAGPFSGSFWARQTAVRRELRRLCSCSPVLHASVLLWDQDNSFIMGHRCVFLAGYFLMMSSSKKIACFYKRPCINKGTVFFFIVKCLFTDAENIMLENSLFQ